MTDKPVVDAPTLAALRAKQAMRLVCAEMPHLAGLAHLVRVKTSRYFPVAAIGASGLMRIDPDVFSRIPLGDAAFVLAHELLHLALDTHRRQGNADPLRVNIAHDYIINDMLADELGRGVPLGGLVYEGARHESLEQMLVRALKNDKDGKSCWSMGGPRGRQRRPRPGKSPISEALEKAGLTPPEEAPPPPLIGGKTPRGDLLTASQEGILEPEVTPEERRRLRAEVRKAAVKALGLGALRARMDAAQDPSNLVDADRGEKLMNAVAAAYAPPWQLALQHWIDAVAPAGRSYAKASRRGAERDDGVVLCGRRREGWTLHIVLDTSGSMERILPNILGTIAAFCDGAGVGEVHILQCDIEVTRDEWLEPAQLMEFRIAGFGGSDMSPGLNKLAEDTEVQAALVVTDGYISFPSREPPYTVLWCVVRDPTGYATGFKPAYGEVVFIDP